MHLQNQTFETLVYFGSQRDENAVEQEAQIWSCQTSEVFCKCKLTLLNAVCRILHNLLLSMVKWYLLPAMVCKGLGFAHTQEVHKCQLGSGQGDFQDIQQLSLSSKKYHLPPMVLIGWSFVLSAILAATKLKACTKTTVVSAISFRISCWWWYFETNSDE